MRNNIYLKKCRNRYSRFWMKNLLLGVLLFSCLPDISAANALLKLQAVHVSLDLRNVTMETFFKTLERESEYVFFYKENVVGNKARVSIKVEDESVVSVLDRVLPARQLAYKVKGKQVVIVPDRTGESFPVSNTAEKIEHYVVKGVISDKNGTLPGANIVVKGTVNGTVSDVSGNFSLLIKGDQKVQLVISFAGYKTQEVEVSPVSPLLKIIMEEDIEELGEVVVVGYGAQRKVNLTGSVASVNEKDLEDRPITNISSGLQGLMPGVTVTAGQGRPGKENDKIRIRGTGTLNNSNPFILIDGVESSSMDDVDPNDIENISVLKDAASAAIYGSKASNGVILITTKRGKSGKLHVSYTGYVGISNPTAVVDRVSSADYARLYNRIDENDGRPHRYSDEDIRLFEDGSDPFGHPNTDWIDAAYKTGIIHKHNFNIMGGSEKVKYMISTGYLGQSGILPNSNRRQFNTRINLDMNITDRLIVRLNTSYTKNNFKDPNTNFVDIGSSVQIFNQLNLLSPMIPIYNEDGTYGRTPNGNPIAWLESGQTADHCNKSFTGQLSADYIIFEGLKVSISGSYVDNDHYNKNFLKKIENDASQIFRPNSLSESFSNGIRYNLDVLLNYNKSIGNHEFKVMSGYHAEKYNYRQNSMYRENFPNNELDDMDAGAIATQTNGGNTRELAMLSYFGRLNYDYAGKYLLEANFRADASSRFAPGYRWGYFPSFSGAWRISEESFMQNTKNWLSNLKFRGSWGMLGNQNAVGNDYYPWMNVYSIGVDYPFGGSLRTGYAQKNYKIEDLSWEKSKTWGLGLEVSILNKISLVIDYYNRRTTDIIMKVPVPDEFALGAYQDNVGAMRNRGVEIQLAYNNQWNNWKFNAVGNFSYNKNKIENLGGIERMPDGNFMRQVGFPIDSWYVYRTDGFFQSDEEATVFEDKYGNPFKRPFKGGDIKYVDINHDGKLTGEDRVLYKTKNPVMTFGLSLNSTYKNIDLTVNLTGAGKVGQLFNNKAFGEFIGDAGHPCTLWLDSWTPNNKNAKMPRVAESGKSPSDPRNVLSDFWVVNTTYLRLKTLQLGYTFSKNLLQKVGIQRLRIYYSAENLLTFDSMPFNVDPEVTDVNLQSYPLLKTYSFGVNITF